MIPQKQLLLRTSFILAFWKPWVSRKVLITDTHCRCVLRETGHLPIYISTGSDAPYNSGTVYIPSWKSCAGWPSCLQTESQYVDLSGSMCTPRLPCVSAIFGCHTISWVYQSETVRAPFASLGAGENLTVWHHIWLTIPAELWGLITHNLVYLLGLLLAGGMTEKEIISLCYLFTFGLGYSNHSAVHFLAFAFLAITFWSKQCRVITVI
jgi:hypothetical protein